MASGGFKPLGPSKIPMDTSKAMAILGFNSSQGFENTDMADVQGAFMKKLQRFEHMTKASGNPRNFTNKRDELRRVNEAYQYLIRKRRKLTGRAMTDNWQLVGSKSNKAMDIISSLKGLTGGSSSDNKTGPSIIGNPLLGNQSKKKFDNDMKKQVESESAAAKALAAELVVSAGLELPVVEILNHAGKTTATHETSTTTTTSTTTSRQDKKSTAKHKNSTELRSSILIEEKVRRQSGYSTSSYPGSNNYHTTTYSSISLPSYSSAPPPSSYTNGYQSVPTMPLKHSYSTFDNERKASSIKGNRRNYHTNYRHRTSQSVERTKKPSSVHQSKQFSNRLGEYRPPEVVASTSDLPSRTSIAHDILEAKALEDEGIQMVRKALSTLNLG